MAFSVMAYQILLILAGVLLLVLGVGFLIYRFWLIPKWYLSKNQDFQFFITSENRYEVTTIPLTKDNQREFKYEGQKYYVIEKCSLLNRSGKSLNIYSKGKPQPLVLSYNESKWLDNKSINSILNNELIPKLLQPNIGWRDVLLVLIAITSIGAFIIVIFIALKIFGVIHGRTELVQIDANQLQVVR